MKINSDSFDSSGHSASTHSSIAARQVFDVRLRSIAAENSLIIHSIFSILISTVVPFPI
jgi:hypothetical protein